VIVAVGGHPRHCDCHHSLVELLRQFLLGAVTALILQESPRPQVLCFHDLDSSGASFPVRECTSRIEYHGRSAPAGQHIIWLERFLLSWLEVEGLERRCC
jgi:hypothetical protein